MSLPASYRPAAWHCTLPVDRAIGRLGIGFTDGEGNVVRLAVDLVSAQSLVASLQRNLHSHTLPPALGKGGGVAPHEGRNG